MLADKFLSVVGEFGTSVQLGICLFSRYTKQWNEDWDFECLTGTFQRSVCCLF